jgi:adenylate cyclase
MKPLRTYLIFIITTLTFFGGFNFLMLDIVAVPFLTPKVEMSNEIVVLKIDSKTLESQGSWPWSRNKISKLIELTLDQEPKKVGLDIVFENKNEDSKRLEKVLQDQRVVIGKPSAEALGVGLDESIYQKSNTGLVNFPIEKNGIIYQVKKFENEDKLLSEAVYNKPLNRNKFFLSTKTNLPTSISIADFIEYPEIRQSLKNKYVLIGSTEPSMGDYYSVPEFGSLAGIYIHSLALNQMIQGVFPSINQISNNIILLLIGLIGIPFSYFIETFRRLKPWVIISTIFFGFSIICFYILKLSPSLIFASWLGLFTIAIVKYLELNFFEKQKLYSMLHGQISPNVLSEIIKKQDKIDLGGENFEITVMFTDIRQFTKLSERISAKEVGILLNQVLGKQAEIIMDNGGVVDKYIGDSVMAFWGAPLPDPDQSKKAVKAAIDIMEEFEKNKIEKSLKIGISLHRGIAAVGNFGSNKRFNYTAIGDVVNTASRIENLNKTYNTGLLISQEIYNNCGTHKDNFKFLDEAKIRGKEGSVRLYELNQD